MKKVLALACIIACVPFSVLAGSSQVLYEGVYKIGSSIAPGCYIIEADAKDPSSVLYVSWNVLDLYYSYSDEKDKQIRLVSSDEDTKFIYDFTEGEVIYANNIKLTPYTLELK